MHIDWTWIERDDFCNLDEESDKIVSPTTPASDNEILSVPLNHKTADIPDYSSIPSFEENTIFEFLEDLKRNQVSDSILFDLFNNDTECQSNDPIPMNNTLIREPFDINDHVLYIHLYVPL